VLRYFGDDGGVQGDDRLLLVNLGIDLHLDPAPEPLLAPPADSEWTTLWSSENPKYGGIGMAPLDSPPRDIGENWRIPGHAAVVLKPRSNV
jgi:maltooligosyltrehalose trehalohydrolase